MTTRVTTVTTVTTTMTTTMTTMKRMTTTMMTVTTMTVDDTGPFLCQVKAETFVEITAEAPAEALDSLGRMHIATDV